MQQTIYKNPSPQIKTEPPGPPTMPIVGNMIDFGRNPLGFYTYCARTYGDVVRLQFGSGQSSYLISNPHTIEEVLVQTGRRFAKGYQGDRLITVFLGNGLVTSEGDFWRRQRRLAQPAFHRKRITGYAEVMVAYTHRMVDKWRNGQVRDIHSEMLYLTQAIVSKTLFDADMQENAKTVGDALEAAIMEYGKLMTSVFHHVLSFLPFQITTPTEQRLLEAMQDIDNVVEQIVEERRKAPGDRGDLLSMLMEARDEDGTGMTDQQLRDEVKTLFLAGHETTSNTLTWTFHLLMQHPDIVQKLEAEVDQVLGDRTVTLADLEQLTYTRHVLDESMRLYPPVWAISRQATEDVEIEGYTIPAGSVLQMSQWTVHRDPRYFDDPEAFIPERWETIRADLPKYAYFPFGGGPRLCIGNNFALMEATIILASIVQHYQLEALPKQEVALQPAITLSPKGSLYARILTRTT
ncbi:MAG: Cytochrome P450 [Chloroflexi bacterium AL-W]|nr:Cytochrome P450 [Chloroflexi bacterium AL-N1]NOK67070.1 Cytochrome P450 [Chloroflexi bacterium AL-N10]NOK74638.1 Cytochrome P450 [Chloroflexi bacterium AL-N5]NOK81672.1 Cytochrome P450 [Chloroflexi bacterium AL-W]NOK89142.1 Cytochrome P450 [Chloroflexi bacterium AL-N15]